MKTREALIGENLKRLIKQRKISQKTVAKLAKISETTLSRAVKGKQSLQGDNLASVLKVLGVSIQDLMPPLNYEPPTPTQTKLAQMLAEESSENDRLRRQLLDLKKKYDGVVAAYNCVVQENTKLRQAPSKPRK